MTWPVGWNPRHISLHVEKRITDEDAARQTRTAEAILARLEHQPGLVLADEVGMGKTFVALAVAAEAAWADKGRSPVVVMVPASLKHKWPRDFQVFLSRCVKDDALRSWLTAKLAEDGLSFLRLLDDPVGVRQRIIFLTHGALHRGLRDPWTKLTILRAALHSRRLVDQRAAFPRFAADILQLKWFSRDPEGLFLELMGAECGDWRRILTEFREDPGDDPVPEAIQKTLESGRVDLGPLRDQLLQLPLRDSQNRAERVKSVRQALHQPLHDVWKAALTAARFRSPLLILDEAHHLKNPATALASLFVDAEAAEEANDQELQGALSAKFERMLFLTATPFQLGHSELLNVIDRFRGVRWADGSPTMAREDFDQKLNGLRGSLDAAQQASLMLDARWGSLRTEDVPRRPSDDDPDAWWKLVEGDGEHYSERMNLVLKAFEHCRDQMRSAEERLRPWVIRHLRSRVLPQGDVARRTTLPGAAILGHSNGVDQGLAVGPESLLPFLLVARSHAIACRRESKSADAVRRLTFVEGLASSYEAYRETRAALAEERPTADEDLVAATGEDPILDRYIHQLTAALPGRPAYARHPKVAPTVSRVSELWWQGEKVLVFCHFRATGRALEQHISESLEYQMKQKAAEQLGCGIEEVETRLDRLGDAFQKGPAPRALHAEVDRLLSPHRDLSEPDRESIREVIRRFIRTDSFLVRYFPLKEGNAVERLQIALARTDGSGLSLKQKLDSFIGFLADRCDEEERREYLETLDSLSTGWRRGGDSNRKLLPNVRRAAGDIKDEQRRSLLLAFNAPFFPEVLVASSVMAEGVDLHLDCRHVIHHDLSWNPSTLEQRTGRVDRIGAKAERVGHPINVFLPFVGGTQDEKMYRVVRDRERWFQVLMGEKYALDEIGTDRLAERVPLPQAAAAALTFNLEVG